MIGDKLKNCFKDNEAWVLSYRQECFEQIRLKPSIKIPLYNGSLECELRKYCLFNGRFSDFRAEGGIVKTEEEKKKMAEKHRFKKNREFKQRLDEQEENEEQDIRSFKFLSLERRREAEKQEREHRERKNFKREDRDNGDRKKGGKKSDRDERKSRKPFGKRDDFKGGKGGKRNGKFGNDFLDDDED
jgi:putative N6-adenine-specific DNA methylase